MFRYQLNLLENTDFFIIHSATDRDGNVRLFHFVRLAFVNDPFLSIVQKHWFRSFSILSFVQKISFVQ